MNNTFKIITGSIAAFFSFTCFSLSCPNIHNATHAPGDWKVIQGTLSPPNTYQSVVVGSQQNIQKAPGVTCTYENQSGGSVTLYLFGHYKPVAIKQWVNIGSGGGLCLERFFQGKNIGKSACTCNITQQSACDFVTNPN